MVKSLKDRFQKLIDEENERVSQKLKHVHIPEKPLNVEPGSPTSPSGTLDPNQPASVEVNQDNFYTILKVSECITAFKCFVTFLQEREQLTEE